MRFSFFGVREYPGSSLEAKVILSDGEEAWLKGMDKDEVRDKMTEDTLEGKIYRCSVEMLENNREEIIQHFPDPALRRRNSGYAIDQLLYSDYFDVAYEESLICVSY